MTRRKTLPPTINDGYKQTDISSYFKVSNRASTTSTMSNTQDRTNKENDTEESILSPRKKPKPICSDDERDEIINALLGPLPTTGPPLPKLPKLVLREYQPPQISRTTYELFKKLPTYTYSESSDSDEAPSKQPCRKKLPPTKQAKKRNFKTPLSVSQNREKNLTVKPDSKIGLDSKPIIIDSSDEDFEASPVKIRKGKQALLNRKLTQQESHEKVNDFLVKSVPYSANRRMLLQSNLNKDSPGKNPNCTSSSGISSLLPSTSKTALNTLPSDIIGVHKPTIVSTIVIKPPPRILQEKTKSNSDISCKSNSDTAPKTGEFISTDFTNKTMEILSPSLQSIYSDKTIIYQHNMNFTIRDNSMNSTSKQIKLLENIVINNPQETLEDCTLSPIKNIAREDNAITPTTSSTQLENLEDATSTNTNPITEDDIANSTWITILFTKIVKYIGSHGHLKTMLTGNESDMLKRIFSMPRTEYQFFCFKLFTRIQKWYNIFKLKNELGMKLTDPEMRDMYDCLSENKFVDIDFSEVPCIDLLNHLQRKDLIEICDSFRIKISKEKKCEIIQRLLRNCNRQTTLTITKSTEKILRDRINQKMGICVKLSSDLFKLFNKVHLLYSFTTSDFNKPSDLHFFMIKIINQEINMPSFNVNMDVKIFPSIAQFSRFAEAYECKRAMVEAFDNKEIGHMLELSEHAYSELQNILDCDEEQKPSYLMRFTPGYKYTKTLVMGTKHLARHYPDRVEEWLIFLIEQDQYCSKLRGAWYDTLVMVQYKYLKLYETAANTIIEALDRKDLSKVQIQELTHRAENIKGCKIHKISELLHNKICFVQPPPLREFPCIEIDARAIRDENKKKGKCVYLKTDNGEHRFMSVEEIALDHYYKKGYVNGLHCEGGLLVTIYFILFWDIIYDSAVQDAFILELQYFPLDLMSPEFYTNRKEAIDKRLDEIQSKWPFHQLENFICKIWNEHAHEKSLINANLINKGKDLYNIILCIGRVKLSHMLEKIAKDFKAYHSGHPDLFLWTVQKRQCKFVEVKSEKDKLSAKQKLWLDFLLSVGADAEVCHVHTVGSNVGRKMGRANKAVKKEEKKSLKKSVHGK